jgi:hypothetical protein
MTRARLVSVIVLSVCASAGAGDALIAQAAPPCLTCTFGWTPPQPRTGNLLTIDISSDWLDPPIQPPGDFMLDSVVETGVNCAMSKWNLSENGVGETIPFQLVRFDPTLHPSPADVVIRKTTNSVPSDTVFARIMSHDDQDTGINEPGAKIYLRAEAAHVTAPGEPGYGTNRAQTEADVCGRIAHELFHKMGYQRILTSQSGCSLTQFLTIGSGSIGFLDNGPNAPPVTYGARIWNSVSEADVDLVRFATNSPGQCSDTSGQFGEMITVLDGGGGGGGGGGGEDPPPEYDPFRVVEDIKVLQFPYLEHYESIGWLVCRGVWQWFIWEIHTGDGFYSFYSEEPGAFMGSLGCVLFDGDIGSPWGDPWIDQYNVPNPWMGY